MKTQGEIEAAVCEGISRFEQDYMGRGPKDIRTHLIGDLLVVRLQGVLTAAEQQLVKSLSAEKGRDLLKQVRTQLIETARPVLEAMVQEVTGVKVLSLHHDISTLTGEEVILFTLAEPPPFRDTRKKKTSAGPLTRSACSARRSRRRPGPSPPRPRTGSGRRRETRCRSARRRRPPTRECRRGPTRRGPARPPPPGPSAP